MGTAAILVKWPRHYKQIFVPPPHGVSRYDLVSIGPAVSEMSFENVDADFNASADINANAEDYLFCKLPRSLQLWWANNIYLNYHKYSNEQQYQKTYFQTCVLREDSDKSVHSRSLIRIFIGHILDSQDTKFFNQTTNTPSLQECTGWFESSLGIHVRGYVFACYSSNSVTTCLTIFLLKFQ